MEAYLLTVAEKIIDQTAPEDISFKYYDLKRTILAKQTQTDLPQNKVRVKSVIANHKAKQTGKEPVLEDTKENDNEELMRDNQWLLEQLEKVIK